MNEEPEVIVLNSANLDLRPIQSGPDPESMDTQMDQQHVSSYLEKGDPTERRSKIIHIRRYQATFQKYLQDVQLPDPEGLSLAELEHLVKEIQLTISCRSTGR